MMTKMTKTAFAALALTVSLGLTPEQQQKRGLVD